MHNKEKQWEITVLFSPIEISILFPSYFCCLKPLKVFVFDYTQGYYFFNDPYDCIIDANSDFVHTDAGNKCVSAMCASILHQFQNN